MCSVQAHEVLVMAGMMTSWGTEGRVLLWATAAVVTFLLCPLEVLSPEELTLLCFQEGVQ